MGRVSVMKTNFTSGEISPRLLARVDVAKFQNGCKQMVNAYPLVHGGAKRRPGLRFTAAAKNATKQTRLIPFVFSRTQAFMLEFGEQYIRFYTGTGQVLDAGSPYEIAAPWDDTELDDLHYCQGADTLFLAHPSYPMRKLVRYSNTSWKLSEVAWEVPPSEEIGERPATGLTLSATSGAGVTATAAAAAFQTSDVGRFIESGTGRAEIVGFTSTTVVTVNVADAFAAVGIASATWKITDSPRVQITPSASGPVGAACTLTASVAAWKNDAQVNHVGMFVELNDGLVQITGFTSATVVSGIIRTPLTNTTPAESGGWALRQTVWNSIDGYPRAVTLYQQRLIAAGSINYPATVWGSKTGEYFNFADGVGDSDGFAFALSSTQVNTVEHLAAIKKVLMPFTLGSEWVMTGGVEKPLSPTNVNASDETAYGTEVTRPVRVANEIVFTQFGGKKIRATGYRADSDGYNSPDISVLSEHITGDGILEMAYAQDPDNIVWMVRADGYLVSMTIDRDQDMIGFARHNTNGEFESVAVMPYNGTSQVWAVVVRTIGGSTVRYIERFEAGLQTDSCVTGAVTENAVTSATWAAGTLTLTRAGHGYATGNRIRLSSFVSANDVAIDGEYEITVTGANTYTVALTDDPGTVTAGTDAKATTAWSGFDHLEGRTLDIAADGYAAIQQTVSSGAITLAAAAYEIEGGLPYTTTIQTLPPEVSTGQGTAQGNALSIHEVIVRFHETKGGTVNGRPIFSRKFGTSPKPLPVYTGDHRLENLGWGRAGSGDSDGTITIVQDQPLPMQVLGVVMRLTAND